MCGWQAKNGTHAIIFNLQLAPEGASAGLAAAVCSACFRSGAYADRQGVFKYDVFNIPFPSATVLASGQMLAQPLAGSAQARALVSDLHSPNRKIYWTDLLFSASVGWAAFASAVVLRPGSAAMLVALAIGVLALYRAICFLHEISHVRRNSLRHFEEVWNALIGIPLLLPSFLYVGVHPHHHGLTTYGTNKDPEYLPFRGKPWMILFFTLQALTVPAILLLRFFVLAPAGFIFRGLRRWLHERASALCLNVNYRREISIATERSIWRSETAILIFWGVATAVLRHTHLALRAFIEWYAVSASAAVVNAIRTLGAHRYASDGSALDREGQLADSIDTPGHWWSELWAPVGLRYHALHHYFPGIPYHNLAAAYARLMEHLPRDSAYRNATSPGLPNSLDGLYRGSDFQNHRHN